MYLIPKFSSIENKIFKSAQIWIMDVQEILQDILDSDKEFEAIEINLVSMTTQTLPTLAVDKSQETLS